MRAFSKIAYLPCVAAVCLFPGCSPMQTYEHQIRAATEDIAAAAGNAQRAAAYSRRGSAYSEKARYSRAFKLIPAPEYERLFGLAIADHDRAIALDPSSAEAYYNRGRAYYDRAVQETVVDGLSVGTDASRKTWFAPAAADFRRALEKNSKYEQAWDMLGLTHESTGEWDQAIDDYSHEMALNSLGRHRLADAYCARGGLHQKENRIDAAVADYEQSVAAGASADGCSCDPYNPLLALYSQGRQYDRGWAVVHKALQSGKWISPDLLQLLKQKSVSIR